MSVDMLTGVSETLLIPLAARARSRDFCPELAFSDPGAAQLLARLGADVGRFHADAASMRGCCVRAHWLDRQSLAFAGNRQAALYVNLGAGLDTTRERLSGALPADTLWVDVDLPAVVELKRRHMAESSRYRFLAADVVEDRWLTQLPAHDGRAVVVRAEGLLMYLAPEQLAGLLFRLAEHFQRRAAGTVLLFDWICPLGVRFSKHHPSLRQTQMARQDKAPFQWAYVGAEPLSRLEPRWHCQQEFDLMSQCGGKARAMGRVYRWLTGRSFAGCSSFALAA